jgi:hypothetical protein
MDGLPSYYRHGIEERVKAWLSVRTRIALLKMDQLHIDGEPR